MIGTVSVDGLWFQFYRVIQEFEPDLRCVPPSNPLPIQATPESVSAQLEVRASWADRHQNLLALRRRICDVRPAHLLASVKHPGITHGYVSQVDPAQP